MTYLNKIIIDNSENMSDINIINSSVNSVVKASTSEQVYNNEDEDGLPVMSKDELVRVCIKNGGYEVSLNYIF